MISLTQQGSLSCNIDGNLLTVTPSLVESHDKHRYVYSPEDIGSNPEV